MTPRSATTPNHDHASLEAALQETSRRRERDQDHPVFAATEFEANDQRTRATDQARQDRHARPRSTSCRLSICLHKRTTVSQQQAEARTSTPDLAGITVLAGVDNAQPHVLPGQSLARAPIGALTSSWAPGSACWQGVGGPQALTGGLPSRRPCVREVVPSCEQGHSESTPSLTGPGSGNCYRLSLGSRYSYRNASSEGSAYDCGPSAVRSGGRAAASRGEEGPVLGGVPEGRSVLRFD